MKSEFEHEIKIVRSDPEKRLVCGVVYEPYVLDKHNTYMRAESIERAAHDFAMSNMTVGIMHKSKAADCAIVESYIAPCDLDFSGQPVACGAWLIVVYVGDDDVWDAVKSGELSGLSMGGVFTFGDT